MFDAMEKSILALCATTEKDREDGMKKVFFLLFVMVLVSAAGESQACVDLPEHMPIIASAAYATPIPHVSPGKTPAESSAAMEFVHVVGGCYCMGVNPGEGLRDASPAHQVCVDDYYIGKYEVTQAQWQEIMGNNPSTINECGDNCPVVDVSWNDAQEFIRRLSERTGKIYRLPTEAEWEYAVRNGMSQGTNVTADASGAGVKNVLHPVGWSEPNSLGIYDMRGSVWEWTADWYRPDYYKKSPQNNPEGPSAGLYRVLRGGSWDDKPESIQPTLRIRYTPSTKRPFIGFRLMSPDQLSAKYRSSGELVLKAQANQPLQCGLVQETLLR